MLSLDSDPLTPTLSRRERESGCANPQISRKYQNNAFLERNRWLSRSLPYHYLYQRKNHESVNFQHLLL